MKSSVIFSRNSRRQFQRTWIALSSLTSERQAEESLRQLQNMDERLAMLEDSVVSMLELVKQVVSLAGAKHSAKDES